MDCLLWCFIHLCLWSHRDSEPSECCWRPDMHWCVCVFVWVHVFLPPSYFAESLFMTTYLDKQFFFFTHLTKKADLCWLGEARQQIKASDSKSNTLSVKVSLSAPITRQKGGTRWWKGGYRTCRQGDPNWCAFLSFTITWINVYTEPHVFFKNMPTLYQTTLNLIDITVKLIVLSWFSKVTKAQIALLLSK